jgi:murein DD-endopeptidase MepM/ murein hydrolase activator NlpD
MHPLRLPIALAVYLATIAAAAFSGRSPWEPLQRAQMIRVGTPWVDVTDTLRPGETLGQVLARQGLAGLDLSGFARIGFDPRRLQPGLIFKFRRATYASAPSEIRVRTSPEEGFRLWHQAGGWGAQRDEIRWSGDQVVVGGIVGSSLHEGLDEGVPDKVLEAGERMRLAWDLADVFAWSVDFTRDLQPGDRFAAVVERRISPDGEVRYGRILAATLEINGTPQTAIRFAQGGPDGFYDSEGRSLRRAFLAAPVEFRRISSSFSRARYHPILHTYRRHAGIDYAAEAGTPIMAAGDGTVVHAGWTGGYGILVEIRHRNGVTTRYGHMRGVAKGIAIGARVGQGQVIGYVGNTGLSTAPHLHYEFRVNGAPLDPRRVQMPAGPPVSATFRASFEQMRDQYTRLLVLRAPHETKAAD